MSWSTEEWDAFTALLAGWWPGEFTEPAADAWRLALDDVEPGAAITALRALLLEGRRFRPSASELVAALRVDPSVPTFDEAYPMIYRAAARQELPEHGLVAAFVRQQGLARLGQLPLDDPQWGEKHRRDLRDAWDRFLEAADGRQVAALASGDRAGLKRLDPGLYTHAGSADESRELPPGILGPKAGS